MKKMLMTMFVLMLGLSLSASADEDVKLDVTGQVRIRGELSDKSFKPDSADFQAVTMMRTRINFEAKVKNNATAFVQLQDSRVWGAPNQFGSAQSGGLNDSKNIDLHQAYIKIDNVFGKGWGMAGGRFEYNLGNQRHFGAVGWDNVGRVWEGGAFWYKNENLRITAVALKGLELDDPVYDRDFNIYGLTAKFNKANLELFALIELDSDTTGTTSASGVEDARLSRLNLGGHYSRKHNQLDFDLNFALQTGTARDTVGSPMPKRDISAMMFAFETGYSLGDERNTRFAVGLDYSSGSDTGEVDIKTYQNSYYTGHKFRGYMDYFVPTSTEGLVDIMLRGKTDITKGWTVKGDIHFFKAAKEYVGMTEKDTSLTKDKGTEIDITVTTSRIAGVKGVFGVSAFLPSDAMAGRTDNSVGWWIYEQWIVSF